MQERRTGFIGQIVIDTQFARQEAQAFDGRTYARKRFVRLSRLRLEKSVTVDYKMRFGGVEQGGLKCPLIVQRGHFVGRRSLIACARQ